MPVSCGEYDIVYTLPREGRYKVWVRIYGWDIGASPFIVTCLQDSSLAARKCLRSQSSSLPRPRTSSGVRLRSRRSTPGGRRRPVSVHTGSSGGSSGLAGAGDTDLVMVTGARGRARGEFLNPQAVAITFKGDILVTDSNNQNVQVSLPLITRHTYDPVQMFSDTGVFIARWGTRGRLPGQLQRPTGLAITKEGLVAVSDYENKCVSLFDLDGKYRSRIGAGKLLGPKGLAVTKLGDLVVVDNKGSTVVVFSSEGKIKTKFGTRGSDLPQFAGPHFVAINSHENIIVTDFHNHSVKVKRHAYTQTKIIK